MDYNMTVIPGDGIGPEIVREAGRCWTRWEGCTAIRLIIPMNSDGGMLHWTPMGFRLQRKALESSRKRGDAVLLGAVGGDVGNSTVV